VNISVRSIPPTFRRAGLKFTDTPQVMEVDKKTFAVLKAEPMLVIEELKDDPAGKEKK